VHSADATGPIGGIDGADGVALPAKITFDAEAGDCLIVQTPGGGGWGSADAS
jgi:N-methylhydantoinase B/oxoprolinase/acetone carboxylase alpha subunit